MNEYNAVGKLVHEAEAADGERLDDYLARLRPGIGDRAFWERECEAGRVEVRDRRSPVTGLYDGKRWYIRWFDGIRWRALALADDERPRMRHGYCHIVREG